MEVATYIEWMDAGLNNDWLCAHARVIPFNAHKLVMLSLQERYEQFCTLVYYSLL